MAAAAAVAVAATYLKQQSQHPQHTGCSSTSANAEHLPQLSFQTTHSSSCSHLRNACRYGQCGTGTKDDSHAEPALVKTEALQLAHARANAVVCGRHHCALLTSSGLVFTFGASSFGRLGLHEPAKAVMRPQLVATLQNTPVQQVGALTAITASTAVDITTEVGLIRYWQWHVHWLLC
jgi:Regulator of chromosome condensation (RCC1) repeat